MSPFHVAVLVCLSLGFPGSPSPLQAQAATEARVPPRPTVTTGEGAAKLKISSWTNMGHFLGPVGDRPGDARVANVDIAANDVSSLEGALKAVFEHSGTTLGENTGFHEIKALPRFDGNRGWLMGGTATRSGVRHRFLALVGQYSDSGAYTVSLFQAPVAVYLAWGGPTFLVETAGKSMPEVLTPDFIARVRNTTPEQDVKIADMIVTHSVGALEARMVEHMGVMSAMQGLSADITARTNCIMTTGCVPGTDNQGRTIMTFPNN